jgi:hypothetical protein
MSLFVLLHYYLRSLNFAVLNINKSENLAQTRLNLLLLSRVGWMLTNKQAASKNTAVVNEFLSQTLKKKEEAINILIESC